MDSRVSFADIRLGDLAAQLADPAHVSGGGVAAAASASLAGGLAELVVTLSLRRRANQADRAALLTDAERLRALRIELFHAADRDAAAFADLMDAQRAATASGNRHGYRVSLTEAAVSPIDLAELALEVAEIAERRTPNAPRFAASDLTASVAMCRGAVEAALATAQINIALLVDERDPDLHTLAAELRARCRGLDERLHRLTRNLRSSVEHRS